LVTRKVRWSKETAGYFVACAFSPDGKTLATTSGFAETVIRLWDVASGRELRQLEGHRSSVFDLLFWPDGQKLASAGSDQSIRVWDLASGRSIGVFRGHRNEVWRLVLMPDNTMLVSGSKDSSVRLWDTAHMSRDRAHTRLPTRLCTWCFDTDSRSVLTVDRQGKVTRWQGDDFGEMQPMLDIGMSSVPSYFSYFRTQRFSQDRRLLAAASPDGVVRIWDLQRRSLLKEMTPHTGMVFPIEFLSGGTKLVLLHPDDGSLHEWDIAMAQETLWWQGPARPSAVAFSPDEQWCLMFSYAHRSLLRDMATGRETDPKLDWGTTQSVAFSPDGRVFAEADWASFARLWETATQREVATYGRFLLSGHSVAFTPDGTRLAVGGNGGETMKLWDMESQQELLTLESQDSIFLLSAFSPDGGVLGSLSSEGFLHLWRAPSWEEIADAERKPQSVASP
jgi:WD40 repeat protein